MPSRPRRGPDVDQGHRERRRSRDRDALTCWVGWWACQDLNLGPHPYQGSAREPVSAGSRLQPARMISRWRPLETVANRSAPMACGPNVDQTRPLAGAAALRVADLGWGAAGGVCVAEQASPPGNRLARGSLAGSGPGTSPCIDGLSPVTGMVVPQRPSCPRPGYLLRSAG